MKKELKDLLLSLKEKINNDTKFDELLKEIINETNYNNFYEQDLANEDIAEQIVETHFIEVYDGEDDLHAIFDDIMKVLFYLEGDEKLVESYNKYIDTILDDFKEELK